MPGEAKTSEFLLSTATVMIGPQAKVMELTPALHSVGLIKNVQVSTELGFTELTQGVQNQVVSSVNNSVQNRIGGELYEYTARNLAYGAGLDGGDGGFDTLTTQYALTSAVAAGVGSTIALASGGTDFAAGDFVILQDTLIPDRVFIGKVASVSINTLTLATGYTFTAENTGWLVASTVAYKVRRVQVGSVAKQQRFGAKLVGILPETGEPITLIFPKVAITKGLGFSFQTENFSNMPFEFMPYALVSTDPFYADYGAMKTWSVLRR